MKYICKKKKKQETQEKKRERENMKKPFLKKARVTHSEALVHRGPTIEFSRWKYAFLQTLRLFFYCFSVQKKKKKDMKT